MDRVIISGGENISPERVEARLMNHPAIEEAIVIGRPSEEWGQRPIAWLVPCADVPVPDENQLKQWCRAVLSGFETPDAYYWCQALPRTALGKVSLETIRSWPVPDQ